MKGYFSTPVSSSSHTFVLFSFSKPDHEGNLLQNFYKNYYIEIFSYNLLHTRWATLDLPSTNPTVYSGLWTRGTDATVGVVSSLKVDFPAMRPTVSSWMLSNKDSLASAKIDVVSRKMHKNRKDYNRYTK